ncbi:hypothetical protein [Microbacterium pumilum]|uniref:Cell division protein FtsL n=1 Tax=Microbacterium pumilum TaxID=344165 RepID=A0ABP5DWG9_9MICO
MSATATVRPAAAPAPRRKDAPRERLRVVEAPARRRRPRQLYGIVAVLGAITIGAAQMTLSILTTQTSYELSSLAGEQRTLTYQKQMLYDDVAGLSSPQYLAANAAALGMVIDESPNYLRLSDGALLGAGDVSLGKSSVDAIGRGVVANALITDTPLVTDPDATIEGVPVETPADNKTGGKKAGGKKAAVANTPAPVTDGLPTPSTH